MNFNILSFLFFPLALSLCDTHSHTQLLIYITIRHGSVSDLYLLKHVGQSTCMLQICIYLRVAMFKYVLSLMCNVFLTEYVGPHIFPD